MTEKEVLQIKRLVRIEGELTASYTTGGKEYPIKNDAFFDPSKVVAACWTPEGQFMMVLENGQMIKPKGTAALMAYEFMIANSDLVTVSGINAE